jgi:hypothetical protein
LITAELDFCPVLKEPSVIYGDRETELLKVMSADGFGLYVEGVSFSWTQADILKRLHTKLYQGMAPPMIFVRTLRKVNNVLLLCLDVEGTRALTTVFQKIWKTDSVPLSLTYPAEDTAQNRELKDEVERSRVLLAESGCAVNVREGLVVGPDLDAAEALKDQGLVAIAAGRHIKKDSPELQWLNLIKTSALLAFH